MHARLEIRKSYGDIQPNVYIFELAIVAVSRSDHQNHYMNLNTYKSSAKPSDRMLQYKEAVQEQPVESLIPHVQAEVKGRCGPGQFW